MRADNAAELQRIDSPLFDKGEASISSSATLYSSQAPVERHAKVWSNPHMLRCTDKLLVEASPKLGKVVREASTLEAGGYAAPNVVGTVTGRMWITFRGRTLPGVMREVFITGPYIEVVATFDDDGKAIPKALRTRVVEALAARAARV